VWVWQAVSGIDRRIYRMYMKYLDKYQEWVPQRKQKKSTCSKIDFEVKPPSSPEINPSDLLSVETLKSLLYSVAIGKEETLHQRVLRPLRPIANAWDLRKCAIVNDQICPCVHWLGRRIFWEFLVNCNLVNNKNWTVIGLGMCIVNVMLGLSKILHS